MLWSGEQRRGFVVCFAVIVLFLVGMASGTAVRSYYDITTDSSGAISGGSGDGYEATWYYYQDSNEYVMWFYNQPYDASREGALDTWAMIQIVDPDQLGTAVVSYGWATPEWSALGKAHPPLPTDTGGSTENGYMATVLLQHVEDKIFGTSSTIEPHNSENISYNPDWVCILVRGKNTHVSRWVQHDCVAGTDSNDNGGTSTDLGACCDTTTGNCYIASSCVNPYVRLAAGRSCSDCLVENFTWDFGDAPASYPVLLSQNGARHTVKTGVYLGSCVTADSDGQPSSTATGDNCDDGVVFTRSLVPGESTTVRITASANGVINAWIDWNRDGDWADAGEKVLVDEPVTAGTNTISFSVPPSASVGDTFARFRYSTVGGLSYTGLATDGEVEDYRVQVVSSDGQTTTKYPAQSPSKVHFAKWSQAAVTVSQVIKGWHETSSYTDGPILADDWSDQDQRPIIGVRWWGCFNQWVESYPPTDVPTAFRIGIWTDAVGGGSPSALVWETTCSAWAWNYSGLDQDPRGLLSSMAVFEFNIMLSQDQWFYPTSALGSRYWVSISAVYSTTPTHAWGFLTRQYKYGTGATRILTTGSTAGASGQWPPQVGSLFISGLPVVYPSNVPWDLSFELISSKPSDGSGSTGTLAGDVNGDGKVTVDDLVKLVDILIGAKVSK